MESGFKTWLHKFCDPRLHFRIYKGRSKGTFGNVDSLCQLLLYLNDVLQSFLTETHRFQHRLFWKFFRASLNHHYRVERTSDSQIETALEHLGFQRINHKFIIDIANA